MNNRWLNDIKDRVNDHEVAPPEGLWDDICATMDRRRRRAIVFRRLSAAAAVLAVFVGVSLVLLLVPRESEMSLSIYDTEIETDRYDINEGEGHGEGHQVIISDGRSDNLADVYSLPSCGTKSFVPAAECVMVDEVQATAEQADTAAVRSEDHMQVSENDRLQVTVSGTETLGSRNDRYEVLPKSALKNRVSVGLYATAGGVGGMLGHESGPRLGGGTIMNDPGMGQQVSWSGTPLLGIMLLNRGQEVRSEVKHHLPVTTGLSIGYRLSDRISLSTGVTYTYASSDMFDGSDANYVASKQSLHYIGVPLRINWLAYRWSRLDLYLSAGPKFDKCVSGRIKRDFVLDGHLAESSEQSVNEHPVQWSVNASAGISFALSDFAGLYVEPGLSYHFDDGTDLKTVFKDHPLNFDLNIGVRFTLNSR